MSILAIALGQIASEIGGLSKITLPRTLPNDFKHRVADAARAKGVETVVLGDRSELGEINPHEAVRFRTPESPSVSAVLLIATEGGSKDLKSLETYRDMLHQGLPGGLRGSASASVQADRLLGRVANLAIEKVGSKLAPDALGQSLEKVAAFLFSAYETAGNSTVSWASAFWGHLDQLANALPLALAELDDNDPALSAKAAFLAAGLPCPSQPDGYRPTNDGQKYVKVLEEHWNSIEEIERTLICFESFEGTEPTALKSLNWEMLPNSRAIYRHIVPAIAFHGYDVKEPSPWLQAWSETFEDTFFQPVVETTVEIEIESAGSGRSAFLVPVINLGAERSVFVLPQPLNFLDPKGSLLVAEMTLRGRLPNAAAGAAIDLVASLKPKGSWSVQYSPAKLTSDGFEIGVSISRKFTAESTWNEGTISLILSPKGIRAGSPLINDIIVLLVLPNPCRPTVFMIEHGKAKSKPKLRFHSNARVSVDVEGRALVLSESDASSRTIKLESNNSKLTLCCAGKFEGLNWGDGTTILIDQSSSATGILAVCPLGALPDTAAVVADGFDFDIELPASTGGEITPLVALAKRNELVPAMGETYDELARDPRFALEQWLLAASLGAAFNADIRSCLATAVLASEPRRSCSELRWSCSIGAFTDLETPVDLKYPQSDAVSEAKDEFWSAFMKLDLRRAGNSSEASCLPSALDLTAIGRAEVEAYLEAFCRLLKSSPNGDSSNAWLAYPFSFLIVDPGSSKVLAALLSPLHPIRLAWHWSAQHAVEQLAENSTFAEATSSFLRFLDGEQLPLFGPALRQHDRLMANSLAPGRSEFFAAWSFLTTPDFHREFRSRKLSLMGRELPLGAPSGLDRGGMFAAIKDYLRIYPFTQQLRIGLSSGTVRQKYEETDDAIVSAAIDLIARQGFHLPGGIRVYDSENRTGSPPDANRVLRKLEAVAASVELDANLPSFEWTKDNGQTAVDIRFIEDSPVDVKLAALDRSIEHGGSTGPSLPVNRFKAWSNSSGQNAKSLFSTSVVDGSFAGLRGFAAALLQFESCCGEGLPIQVEGELTLGDALLGDKARWSITGNRHLNPVAISMRLKQSAAKLMLWEWRPAFLSRSEQRGTRSTVVSGQPYSIIARTPEALGKQIGRSLENCGVAKEDIDAQSLLSELGTRGIGLASLVTMGHSQSMGALGFYFAFKSLEAWEQGAEANEIRCVVPMDAVFPLLDALAEGAKTVDEQKRADLICLKATLDVDGRARIILQPVEVKARSEQSASFPNRNNTVLADPFQQLKSTRNLLNAISRNLTASEGNLHLVNAALATLIEAALSLRPAGPGRSPANDIKLLCAASNGLIEVFTTDGILLWLQAGSKGMGGADFESRPGSPSAFFSNFARASKCVIGDEYTSRLAQMIEGMSPEAGDRGNSNHKAKSRKPGETKSQRNSASQDSGKSASSAEEVPSHGKQQNGNATNARPQNASGRQAAEGSLPEDQTQGDTEQQIAASEVGDIQVLIGHRNVGSLEEPVIFRPSDTALNQLNIGVVGDLGTGKTQFLKSLVYQIAKSAPANRGKAPKTFIFDYKQDYATDDFAPRINATILDPTKTLPLNFFSLGAAATQVQKVSRANFFADMLRRISGIGQVQRQHVYESIMEAYGTCAEGHWPLIHDVFDIYRQKTGGRADSVVSVLSLVTDLKVFEDNPDKVVSFNELFTGNTVLKLSDLGGAGQEIVDIVATMFLDHLYQDYMKRSTKAPFLKAEDGTSRRQVDTFILIDEAHHAMGRGFDVLNKLMLEGREFGLGVILSSQYLSHFKEGGRDWTEALSTWVVHNVRNTRPRDFDDIGFGGDTRQISSDVSSLQTHWAYYRCANGESTGTLVKGMPFFKLVD